MRKSTFNNTIILIAMFLLILDDSEEVACLTEYIDYTESTSEEDDEVLYVKTLKHPHLHKRNLLFRK